MKTFFQVALLAMTVTGWGLADEFPLSREQSSKQPEAVEAFNAAAAAQPKLLRISGIVDGSGRVVFTRKHVRYEHRHWARPHHLLFDGEPWEQFDQTPAGWKHTGQHLDLTRARIVQRNGRDMIALERTPDGFDLYLSDSPNGAAEYSVTIAIPRR
ncbi:hypothetical protein GC176_21365 [bacterium]|nr:hypothetical protein [bacterium]